MTSVAVARCARCGSELEMGDLRCPICGLAVEDVREVLPAERAEARVVRCDTCGASLEYSAEARAPRCAYCTSVMHVETAEDPVEQAEAFLPFMVSPEEARGALKRFLKVKHFFRPGKLASEAVLHTVRPMWWPAWAFSVGARVSWAADSNVGSRRSEWAPHAGQVDLTFREIRVSASRGLTEGECERLAGHYRLESGEKEARGPEGAWVERFDVTRSGARRQILAVVEAMARQEVERTCISGTRHRNVHVAVALSKLDTMRYALPAYVLAYRYRDELYRVVVHGQDASVVSGKAPISWGKVVLMAGGLLLLALLAFFLTR